VFSPLLAALSPAGFRARLSILIFHRVLATTDPLFPEEPDAKRFDQLLGWIKSWFNVIPLDEGARRLGAGTLPERAAAITFDDGYADNFQIALPLLKAHELPATFFIATGYLDGGRMWNDTIIEAVRRTRVTHWDLSDQGLPTFDLITNVQKRHAIDAMIHFAKHLHPAQRSAVATRIAETAEVPLPSDLMMTSGHLVEMREAGMGIGAHTVSHPILARLDPGDAEGEISDSKVFLERLLGEPVGLFAYPNGKPGEDWLPEHAIMVRRLGFDAAVSTAWGAARAGSDPMQLPRFTPWDRTRPGYALRLAANLIRKT
jgi:peptidoglycan/xylan/chitin deacetylase (PgdA/CDA1 family)